MGAGDMSESPAVMTAAKSTASSPGVRTMRPESWVEDIGPVIMRPVKKEKVPVETMPSEAPWAPRELEANPNGHDGDKSGFGGQWGTLSQDLLQATRAALLVPREITLDDVSLERLETVTARPLSELAAALLQVEPGSANVEPLMLTDTSMDPGAPLPSNDMGNGHADELKQLTEKYHHQLRTNSDIRAQVAALQSGLGSNAPGSPPAASNGVSSRTGNRLAPAGMITTETI